MDASPKGEAVISKPATLPDTSASVTEPTTTTAASTPNGIKSSPPLLQRHSAISFDDAMDTAEPKSDSEAETIVLPGMDGHSPSKIRKSIKHEAKSEDEGMDIRMVDSPSPKDSAEKGEKVSERVKTNEYRYQKRRHEADSVTSSSLGKRKRPENGEGSHNNDSPLTHDGQSEENNTKNNDSSSLSIPSPSSPIGSMRSLSSRPAGSDSELSRSPSPRASSRDKATSVERGFSRKKQGRSGSGDEDEGRRYNRHRSSGADPKRGKVQPSVKGGLVSSRKRTRSVSPPARSHRRSTSTQMPSFGNKKKRIPAPLQSTEYQSDDSSASGASHPRSSRLRHLAAPTTGESVISPAKMPPHKKNVNSSGQTFVARACASGKLEIVKQRLEDRPEDLDEGDYAQNTPLHYASIAGYADIVKYLLDAGCVVDPINIMRDTPLHDAIDNGHLDVVKLLLDAGANPRKTNGKGEDPYNLVEDDTDVTEEMREAILAATQRTNGRRSSGDDQLLDVDNRTSRVKGSPQNTPPIQAYEAKEASITSRRNASTRAMKTSDTLLYQPMNKTELRNAAAEGDSGRVATILDVHNGNLDDARSLIIAAKAGHDTVISVCFACGQFNPDPEPVGDQPPESATPMLAAIGRQNLEVIKLFLNHENFDPTRSIYGDTYHEIAKKRAGPMWKEEEALLKDAYEKYTKNRGSFTGKPQSPAARRNGREIDRDAKRIARKDDPQNSRSHKRSTSGPVIKDADSNKHQRNVLATSQSKDNHNNVKRGPGRPRKDEGIGAESDHETTPPTSVKQKSQVKKSELERVATSENEATAKPRRKLVSRGERELEKQRRTSVASTASSVSINRRDTESTSDKIIKEKSPVMPRPSKLPAPKGSEVVAEKQAHDRSKPSSLKRDDSKDRLSAIRGESPVKRPRKSETPPRSIIQEGIASNEASGSPQKKRKLEGDSRPKAKTENSRGSSPDHYSKSTSGTNLEQKGRAKDILQVKDKESTSSSKQTRVESPVRSRNSSIDGEKGQDLRSREREEQVAQARREQAELEAKEKAEKAAKLELESLEETRRAEQAELERMAREKAAREELLKREIEEKERRERQIQEDAEAHRREQEQLKAQLREQEKRKLEEQAARRAAEQEMRRAERQRLEREKEAQRLAKLPLLLRWLDMTDDPKNPRVAKLFRSFPGFRYDTIKEEATGNPDGRERWMLNTQVALLLGEKDLQLSRYTAWDRIPLSLAGKEHVWRVDNGMYMLRDDRLWELQKQVLSIAGIDQTVKHCHQLFLDLDLFFVKVSEFMYVVPSFPHLRDIEMTVNYRELVENFQWPPLPGKYLQDPDRDTSHSFPPQPDYYNNGELTRRGQVPRSRISSTPFPERRVPRRNGLQEVYPHEPDYLPLARQQGLFHLLPQYSQQGHQAMNQARDITQQHLRRIGITPPHSDKSKSLDGQSPVEGATKLPNGLHIHTEAPENSVTD